MAAPAAATANSQRKNSWPRSFLSLHVNAQHRMAVGLERRQLTVEVVIFVAGKAQDKQTSDRRRISPARPNAHWPPARCPCDLCPCSRRSVARPKRETRPATASREKSLCRAWPAPVRPTPRRESNRDFRRQLARRRLRSSPRARQQRAEIDADQSRRHQTEYRKRRVAAADVFRRVERGAEISSPWRGFRAACRDR